MIRNLTAMTASQLKKDLRDERKKSMLSRLSPEAGKLFNLLAARDWDNKNPRILKSMKPTETLKGLWPSSRLRQRGGQD
jgi:hypothetical protein